MPKFFKGKDKEETEEGDRKKILSMNLPTIDRTKLKGSLKCIKWVQKKIQKKGAAFPLFMILLNAVYLTLGGLIFMAVERQPKVVINTTQELVEIFDVLKVSLLAARDARGIILVHNFYYFGAIYWPLCEDLGLARLGHNSKLTKLLDHVLFSTPFNTERKHNK